MSKAAILELLADGQPRRELAISDALRLPIVYVGGELEIMAEHDPPLVQTASDGWRITNHGLYRLSGTDQAVAT